MIEIYWEVRNILEGKAVVWLRIVVIFDRSVKVVHGRITIKDFV